MNKKLFSSTGLLLVAVVTVVTIGLFNQIGKYIRVDLTENKLHTISLGSKRIVSSLEKPLELNFFFSNQQTKNIPELRNYARRVEDLLNEYVIISGGHVTLQKIDPEPFSEDEDKAAEFGLQAIPIAAGGDSIYFGLAAENEAGDQEIIEFFHPDKEEFLEYQISQMIYRLSNPEPTVVGLMSNLPVQGGFNMAARQATPPWMLVDYIEQMYEVRTVDVGAESIEEEIDVLMLIHPKSLSEQTQYAIDQFVLRGGRLMLFVDPLAEMEQSSFAGHNSDQHSNLPKLMKHWGVELVEGKVLGDAKHAMQINTGDNRRKTHLGLLNYGTENFAKEHIVTNQLQAINIGSSGILKRVEGATTTFEPLLVSSDLAMPMEATKLHRLDDPTELLDTFKPTNEIYTTIVQISGEVESAFPDGKPELENSEEGAEGADETAESSSDESEESDATAEIAHIAKSNSPINVIVFADTDILSDRLWVRVQEFFGRRIPVPWANNAEFITNALDSLSGSSELISVRSRGKYSRPFTVVQTLQKDAEMRFREKERELQLRLKETEEKLTELQRPPEDGQQILSLTPEQENAIISFQDEKLKIRKQLREVRHQLDQDIERLGVKLKLYNVAAVPFGLTLLALIFSWRKRQRRRVVLD